MFGQMGDMYRLQREAKKIKKELAQIHVFSEVHGVKVTVSGEQKVLAVEFVDESILQDPRKCEKAIVEAANRATEKAQQVAAEKMKALMGGMDGFPGAQQ